MKPPKPLERDVLKSCVAVAAMMGVRLERQNTGRGTYRNKDGTTRTVAYGRAGNLDLKGILPGGKAVEVEIKRPGNRPTKLQYRRMREINTAGGVAFWTDDPKHFEQFLRFVVAGACAEIDEEGDPVVLYRSYEAKGDQL